VKLAITRRGFLTDLDGVNRFVFTLADGLNALDHEVHVLSYSCHDISPSKLSSFSKRIFDAEGNTEIHTLVGATTKPTWSRIAFTWGRVGSKLLKELGVDAVVINGITPLRSDAIKLAVNHGIFHGDFRFMTGLRRKFCLEMARMLYRYNVDTPVCVAPRLKRELKKYLGIDFMVVPLPLKLYLFHSATLESRSNEILHVGTRSEKNVETSISIIRMLREEMKIDARLVVVGPKNTYIKNLMKRYENLTPRYLDFRLDISSLELRRLLARARALLLPSRYEAFSYTVLEAFASGLPVVVSGAVPGELVADGQNGFRLPTLELHPYAARLADLFTNSGLWKAISANAIETASGYAHVKIAEKYENLIAKTLSQRRCRRSPKVLIQTQPTAILARTKNSQIWF
jgi:glycosyltransferase involved in cell wall biosynthesis